MKMKNSGADIGSDMGADIFVDGRTVQYRLRSARVARAGKLQDKNLIYFLRAKDLQLYPQEKGTNYCGIFDPKTKEIHVYKNFKHVETLHPHKRRKRIKNKFSKQKLKVKKEKDVHMKLEDGQIVVYYRLKNSLKEGSRVWRKTDFSDLHGPDKVPAYVKKRGKRYQLIIEKWNDKLHVYEDEGYLMELDLKQMHYPSSKLIAEHINSDQEFWDCYD